MTAIQKQQRQSAEIGSCLDGNSAEPARGYRDRDCLAAWEQAAGLTLQSVRNSQSVREIINVHAGPNTLTL
jgi:hypothetical protein